MPLALSKAVHDLLSGCIIDSFITCKYCATKHFGVLTSATRASSGGINVASSKINGPTTNKRSSKSHTQDKTKDIERSERDCADKAGRVRVDSMGELDAGSSAAVDGAAFETTLFSRRLRFLRGLLLFLLEEEEEEEEEDLDCCCCCCSAFLVARRAHWFMDVVINKERTPSAEGRLDGAPPDGDSNNFVRRSNSWLSLKFVAINKPNIAR